MLLISLKLVLQKKMINDLKDLINQKTYVVMETTLSGIPDWIIKKAKDNGFKIDLIFILGKILILIN